MTPQERERIYQMARRVEHSVKEMERLMSDFHSMITRALLAEDEADEESRERIYVIGGIYGIR